MMVVTAVDFFHVASEEQIGNSGMKYIETITYKWDLRRTIMNVLKIHVK